MQRFSHPNKKITHNSQKEKDQQSIIKRLTERFSLKKKNPDHSLSMDYILLRGYNKTFTYFECFKDEAIHTHIPDYYNK